MEEIQKLINLSTAIHIEIQSMKLAWEKSKGKTHRATNENENFRKNEMAAFLLLSEAVMEETAQRLIPVFKPHGNPSKKGDLLACRKKGQLVLHYHNSKPVF